MQFKWTMDDAFNGLRKSKKNVSCVQPKIYSIRFECQTMSERQQRKSIFNCSHFDAIRCDDGSEEVNGGNYKKIFVFKSNRTKAKIDCSLCSGCLIIFISEKDINFELINRRVMTSPGGRWKWPRVNRTVCAHSILNKREKKIFENIFIIILRWP